MNPRLLTLAALVVIVSTACSAAATGAPSGRATAGPDADLAVATIPRASADPADALKAADGMNAFGLDLYRRLATGTGNVVFSPASVAIALSMARHGARGETAGQMDTILRSISSDDHPTWMNALDAALSAQSGTYKDVAGKDASVTLRIANAPFAQRGMAIVPSYLDTLAQRYGAGLRLVDYMGDTEAARVTINRWVSDQTEARIPELLASGILDQTVRLVLVNAIYLKAPWRTPFTPELTKPGPFTKLDGSSVQVPMMASTGPLPYAAGDGWRAVELPYVGDSLAMTIIVPDDLASFEGRLDGATLALVTGALSSREVDLRLPKFGLEIRADLVPALTSMGMPLAFDAGRADFSGITTEERLFISNVVHQANIDVDEKGTTAAAATAVVMRESAAMPGGSVSLRVDRPFLFAVRDTKTGAILFLGRVTEPATR
jgi:serine protease inhibitor